MSAAAKKAPPTPSKRAIKRTPIVVVVPDPVEELASALRDYQALQPEYEAMRSKVDEARRRVVEASKACGMQNMVLR